MTLIMARPAFKGLVMIISGGQTGADQGGLEAAFNCHVMTGGVMPKGWRTVKGPMPHIGKKYNLLQAPSPHYYERTRLNIEASDGTVIIASNTESSGSVQTMQFAKKAKKHCLILPVHWNMPIGDQETMGLDLKEWIIDKQIGVLNVAGNRDMLDTSHHDIAREIVTHAIKSLTRKHLVWIRPSKK